VRFEGDEVVIELAEPVEGVASGQSAVLYAGTRVLGQVTIDRTFLTARVGVDA